MGRVIFLFKRSSYTRSWSLWCRWVQLVGFLNLRCSSKCILTIRILEVYHILSVKYSDDYYLSTKDWCGDYSSLAMTRYSSLMLIPLILKSIEALIKCGYYSRCNIWLIKYGILNRINKIMKSFLKSELKSWNLCSNYYWNLEDLMQSFRPLNWRPLEQHHR